MKKKVTLTKKLFIFGLAIVLTLLPVTDVCAASAKSNMSNVLKYYKKGDYDKATKYCKKLSKTANEKCVKKMSKKMKKAYRAKVKKYNTNHMNGQSYIWDYYLTDIDNDKKAELLVVYGTCEADARLNIYKYKSGKAVLKAKMWIGHREVFAYPNHKGIVVRYGHMGYENIDVVTLKGKKLIATNYGGREISYSEDYLPLRQALKSHAKYGDNNVVLSYKDLK